MAGNRSLPTPSLDGRHIAAAMGLIGIPLALLLLLLSDAVTVRWMVFGPALIVGTVVVITFATRPLDGWPAALLMWLQLGVATVAIISTGWAHSPLSALLSLLLLFAALTQRMGFFVPTIAATVLASALTTVADPDAHPTEWAEFTFGTIVLVAIGLTINILTNGRAERLRLLADREERFRGLAENADDGVFLLRLAPEPRFEYVNPALARMLGVAVEDVYGDPELVTRLVHEDDRHLRPVSRAGTSDPIDVRLTSDAGERWVAVVTQALRDQSGEVHAIQGVVRDITRRRQTEDALGAALEQERVAADERLRLDAMRDGFLRAVTHEVRTPLTTIRGMSELMLQRGDRIDPNIHLDLLARIDSNARRLEMLLGDVLEAARGASPDEDAGTIWSDPIQLADVVHDAMSLIDLRDRDVTVHMPPDAVSLPVRHVRRILDVFLHNVARHTPPGSPVVVTGHLDDAGLLEIAVADRGPGVAGADRDDVFRPFHQGPHTYGEASPGTGIGLTIVHQYAEMFGGRAWVDERDGGGAVFHATLQLERPPD